MVHVVNALLFYQELSVLIYTEGGREKPITSNLSSMSRSTYCILVIVTSVSILCIGLVRQ